MPRKFFKGGRSRKKAMRTFTHDEFKELGRQTTNTLIQYFEESDCEWKIVEKTDDCVIKSRKSKEFNGLLYRADGIIKAAPSRVFEIMAPEAYFNGSVLEWDASIKMTELVDQITENLLVMRSVTHSYLSGLVASRDFVDLVNMTRIGEKRFTSAISIDHPLSEGHVRGRNYTIGIIGSPVPGEPEQCLMTRVLQTDPGGHLPQYLADSVVPSFLSRFYASINRKLDAERPRADQPSTSSWTFGWW